MSGGLLNATAMTPPAVLLPYQQESIRLSHLHQLLVIEKSRRTGITYGFAADSVLVAGASRAAGGMDVYYIAYNLEMTREFIGYCGMFASLFEQAATEASEFLFDDGSEHGIKAFRITFASGFEIVALSSKPRSLRGKQGLIIIDEAAFHDQLAELLKAAIAFHMWGGRTVVISTHDGAGNPFNELIEEIRSGKREGHVQRITLSDALEDGLYKRICLVTGQAWSQAAEEEWERKLRKTYGAAADEELDVIPAAGSGIYIPSATVRAAMNNMNTVLRLACPDGFERQDLDVRESFVQDWLEQEVEPCFSFFDPGRRSYFGQDFARSGDLSVMAFGQEDAHLTLHGYLALELRNVPFAQQRQILNWMIARLPCFCAGKMDARGNGQQLAEEAQDKWGADRIEAVMASDKTYLAFMPKLKARIEDRSMTLPMDDGVLSDMKEIKLVRGVPKIPERANSKADGAKGQRHGDSAIAFMHLVAAADEDIPPVEFTSTGERRAALTQDDMQITGRGFGTVTGCNDFGGYC